MLLAPVAQPDLEAAVRVQVGGPPRSDAVIKDTNWVVDRKPLAARLPPDCAEAILHSESGCLLEGLVTNLFIVRAASTIP